MALAGVQHAQRILELTLTADEGDDTVAVTAVKFYRNRQSYDAGQGFVVDFEGGAAGDTCEVQLAEVIPPPSVIVLNATFQA